MARKRKSGGTSYAYFKSLFEANPEMADVRSNDAILARYREDHGLAEDAEIPSTVRNNLANLKSGAKRKLRNAGGGSAEKRGVAISRPGAGKLETIEGFIDDAMALAKQLDPTGLYETIRLLRKARNNIIMLGER